MRFIGSQKHGFSCLRLKRARRRKKGRGWGEKGDMKEDEQGDEQGGTQRVERNE